MSFCRPRKEGGEIILIIVSGLIHLSLNVLDSESRIDLDNGACGEKPEPVLVGSATVAGEKQEEGRNTIAESGSRLDAVEPAERDVGRGALVEDAGDEYQQGAGSEAIFKRSPMEAKERE